MKAQLYQGDVFLQQVDEIPPDALLDTSLTEGARVILARGEATGHHHSLNAEKAQVKVKDRLVFVEVVAEGMLRHQEHDPIKVKPGLYKLGTQREYTPQEVRRVAD